jgi:hypothetical protein
MSYYVEGAEDRPDRNTHEGQGALEDRVYESSGSRWRRLLSWSALVSLAVLLYELTSQPAVAAVVLCARFGWQDLLTAVWLRRTDPKRIRGRVCFWFYFASAIGKIAAATAVMMTMMVLVWQPPKGPQKAPDPPEFIAVALEGLAGVVLSMMATAWALFLAWWNEVTIWISSDVHRARRRNAWPPWIIGGKWRAGRVSGFLVAQLFIALFPIFLFVWVEFLILIIRLNLPGWVVISLGLGAMCGSVIGFLLVWGAIFRRLIASNPYQCWPILEPDQSIDS